MKSERRHELQQNELADRLTHTIEWCKANGQLILGSLIGVAIIGIGIAYYTSISRKNNQTRWNAYYEAQSESDADTIVDSLEAVATEHEGSPTENWALLSAANRLLDSGMQAVFSNPTQAKEDLDKAIAHYNQLLDPKRNNSPSELIVREATFGLAQAYEGTNQFEQAIAQYKEVAKWEDSAMANTSAERAKYLSNPSIQEWAVWYASKGINNYREIPQSQRQPGSPGGAGGGLPDDPDFGLPAREPGFTEGGSPSILDGFPSPGTTPFNTEAPTNDPGPSTDPTTEPEPVTDPATTEPPRTPLGTAEPEPATDPATPKTADPAPSDPPAKTDDTASENE